MLFSQHYRLIWPITSRNGRRSDSPIAFGSRRRATVALMIATAMQALDTTIANVALPQIEQSLGGGIELGSWVMTSYLCASAIMATLTGWLRRRYGARPLLLGSVGLFVVASGLCSIAPYCPRVDPIPAGPRRRSRRHSAPGAGNPPRYLSRGNSMAECSRCGGRQSWPARSLGPPRRRHRRSSLLAVDIRAECSARIDRDIGAGTGAGDSGRARQSRPASTASVSPCWLSA